ncbi:EpsG family protein [Acinetobacter sp. WZC-1]|uniref:EpsG family protein n=1 Tax=Acinetobacter sp. WZC-1 TaxID=3459034 RepID=UPI00403E051E
MINYLVLSIFIYMAFLFINVFFKKIQMFFVFSLMLFLTFFGANNIETLSLDFKNYAMIFEMVDLASWGSIISRSDPLFLYIVKIIEVFSTDVFIIFTFLIFFSLILKFFICFKFVPKNVVPIFLLLLIGRFYFLHDLTQLRASFAIGLGTLALLFYYKDNFKIKGKTVFLYFLACLFHISLLIVIPLFFLTKKSIRIKNFLLIYLLIILSILLGVFFSKYFSVLISNFTFIDRVSLYFSSQGEEQNVKYSVFQFYFMLKMLVLVILSFGYAKFDFYNKAIVVTYIYAMCLQAIFVFSSAIGLRFAAIFGYIDILVFLIPLSLSIYKRYFNFYFIFISVAGMVFFYSSLLTIGME